MFNYYKLYKSKNTLNNRFFKNKVMSLIEIKYLKHEIYSVLNKQQNKNFKHWVNIIITII